MITPDRRPRPHFIYTNRGRRQTDAMNVDVASDAFDQMRAATEPLPQPNLQALCIELHLGRWATSRHLHGHVVVDPDGFYNGALALPPTNNAERYAVELAEKQTKCLDYKDADFKAPLAEIPAHIRKIVKFQSFAGLTADPHDEGLPILRFDNSNLDVVYDFMGDRGFTDAQVRMYPDGGIHLHLPVHCFRAVLEDGYRATWENLYHANPNPLYRATLPLGNP